MFHVLGHPVICEVSLTTADVVGELDENDLSPTPLQLLLPLLKEINLNVTTYRACVRRFRHWFRLHVMENMLGLARRTFDVVKAAANNFHESNAPLFPLTVQLSNEQAHEQLHWMTHRRQRLEEQLTSNPTDNPDAKKHYRMALCGMQSTIWLLSGSWIPNLIPDGCPTGYLCNRVEQLLQDLAMTEFDGHHTKITFNGEIGHHFPSDSTVLMFLMCVYLKAPGWNLQLFQEDLPRVRNGPLLLMNIDPLADPAYTAFLTSVPSRRQATSNAFILRHRKWTTRTSESVMTLMLNGKLRANFGGIAGFFEAMTVFLAYHRLKFGNVGGAQFEAMDGLDWVFAEQMTSA